MVRKCAVWAPDDCDDNCGTAECPLSVDQIAALDASEAPAALNPYITQSALPGAIGASIPMHLAAATLVGATSITVDSAYDSVVADAGWVIIDPYTIECEIRKVTNVVLDTFTISTLTYAHAIDDLVFWVVNPIANVILFGARGDGATDDAASINRALISGFHAYLPYTGTDYIADTTLLIPSNGALIGESPDVVIKLGANADTMLIQNSDQVGGNSDILIRNIRADGNRPNQTNGLPTNTSHGIHMDSVNGLTLENVYVYDVIDQSLKLTDVDNLHVQNVTADGAGTECWSLDNCSYGDLQDVRALNFDGLDADGITLRPSAASGWGFEVEDGSTKLNFNGVLIENCVQAGGFHTQSHGVLFCSDINISNIQIIDCPSIAFAPSGLDGPMHVSNLHIEASHTGIYLATADDVTFNNFSIETAAGGYGIRFVTTTGTTMAFSDGVINAANLGIHADAGAALGTASFSNVHIVAVADGFSFLSALDFSYSGGSIHSTGSNGVLIDTVFDPPAKFIGTKITADSDYAVQVPDDEGPIELLGCYCNAAFDGTILFDKNVIAQVIGGRIDCDGDGGGDRRGIINDTGSAVSLMGVVFGNCSAGGGGRTCAGVVQAKGRVIGCHFTAGSFAITSVSVGGSVQGNTFDIPAINVAVGAGRSALIRNNSGYVTENVGTATVAAGNVVETVAHGIDADFTPTAADIQVVPNDNMGAATKFWVDNVAGGNFDINVDGAPGGAGAVFAWQVVMRS